MDHKHLAGVQPVKLHYEQWSASGLLFPPLGNETHLSLEIGVTPADVVDSRRARLVFVGSPLYVVRTKSDIWIGAQESGGPCS